MKTQIFSIVKKKKVITWTKDEDQLILAYSKLRLRNKWKILSQKFMGKTATQIYLRSKLVNPELKKGRFTFVEDQKLKELVALFGPSWSFISRILKSRSPKQLRLRYNYYLNEKISKDKFTKAEDDLIVDLFKQHGRHWANFLPHFPNRCYIKIKNRCFSLFNKQKKLAAKNEKLNRNENLNGKILDVNANKANELSLCLEKAKEEKAVKIEDFPLTPNSNAETNFTFNHSRSKENEKKESEIVSKFGLSEKTNLINFLTEEAIMQYKDSFINMCFEEISN